MKRFKDENFDEGFEYINNQEDTNNNDKGIGNLDNEHSYKMFKDEEKKDDFITPSMKSFRKLIGGLIWIFILYSFIFSNQSGHYNYKSDIKSGKIDNVDAGSILSKEMIRLEPKDFSIDVANSYGKIELSIWNFVNKEDGDYVQVFVNGSPQTEPFAIRHKAIKVGVPDDAIIQVKGIRDGSNNGITYGVFFNKTGETYLNTVPLNASNTYTIKNIK